MIESLLVLASPFIVQAVTGITKNFSAIINSGHRVALVRAVVATLSLVTAILSQAIGEGTVTPELIDTAVLTAVNAGVATYMYFKTTK